MKIILIIVLIIHVFYFANFSAAIDCGSLSVPMNGSSSGDSTVFPNSVLFHCDPGFILSGSTKRACQANGTWSGSPTICSGRLKQQLRNTQSIFASPYVAV